MEQRAAGSREKLEKRKNERVREKKKKKKKKTSCCCFRKEVCSARRKKEKRNRSFFFERKPEGFPQKGKRFLFPPKQKLAVSAERVLAEINLLLRVFREKLFRQIFFLSGFCQNDRWFLPRR